MKKSTIIIIALAAVALFAASDSRSQSQSKAPTASRQVVVLWAYQNGFTTDNGLGQRTFTYGGADIYDSSSSGGAPVFPQASIPATQGVQLTKLADGIALLLSQGFTLQEHTPDGSYMFVK